MILLLNILCMIKADQTSTPIRYPGYFTRSCADMQAGYSFFLQLIQVFFIVL